LKLLLSFVAISILGSASIVKFFEAPKELLLGEPIYRLAIAPREDAYQAPADEIPAIPGIAVGNFVQEVPTSAISPNTQKPAAPEIKSTRAAIPVTDTEDGREPEVAVISRELAPTVPQVRTTRGASELTGLAASTAPLDNAPKKENGQELAALPGVSSQSLPNSTAAQSPDVLPEPSANGSGPIANITLPVRAPGLHSISNDVRAALDNGNSTPDPSIDRAAARRLAQARANQARRRAEQQAAIVKAQQAKAKLKAKARWQSSILGDDD